MDQLNQKQLQEVRTELIIEQYNSLREEIIQRVMARQQMWYVLLLIAGTFLTIGVQPSIAVWTILLYPLIAFFFAANWAHNDTRIDQITWYIQYEIEEPLHFKGWETYRTHRFRRNRRGEQQSHPLALPGLLTFSVRGVFLTTQFLAICIGIIRLIQAEMVAVALLLLLVDLIAVLATYFLLSDRKAQILRKKEMRHTKAQDGMIPRKAINRSDDVTLLSQDVHQN